jgi:DNA helicase-2/ATP-dependent DNA helicase PcrA
VSAWKSRGISTRQAVSVAETDKQHLAAAAFRRYQQSLKQAGAVDFDDLLLCTLDLFSRHEDVRVEEAKRFDHLLIDEYQDTNGAQYRIVKVLASRHRNLCVVGDDDQSIYGFRGAEVEHILRFQRDWPDAVVVRLEENYRCTQEILTAANQLIAFNKHRHEKVLRASRPGGEKPRIEQFPDEEAEAKFVVADLARRMTQPGTSPRDFAILFRTNEQPRPFEAELRRARIPYVLIGGMSFFDRREVRDTLAYLKLLEMPHDEVAMLRIINTPPRGIGGKTVEQLMGRAVKEGNSLWHVLSDEKQLNGLPANARTAIAKFVADIRSQHEKLQSGEYNTLHDFARQWILHVGYRDEIDRLYPEESDREMRWSNVEQVVNALAAYEANSSSDNLGDFLRDLTISNRDLDGDKEKELERDAVALMTLHSAKGLEFPQVYMVGMEEGILPHHRSIGEHDSAVDEERRLCYVGITRAQDRLSFTLALTRRKWGKPRETQPSRFLFELIGSAENKKKKKVAKK